MEAAGALPVDDDDETTLINISAKYLRASRRIGLIYQNPIATEVTPAGALPKVLLRALTTRTERVPRKQMSPFTTDETLYQEASRSGLRVTWLGHSTVLLEIDGTTILIDPVWGPRSSPVSWFGPKRFYPPPLPLGNLPRLDAVLLSHDHYDHLDEGTIRRLADRSLLFVCSQGLGAHLVRWGVPKGRIHELNWMESFAMPVQESTPGAAWTPLTITALPARHFSGRGMKRNGTLWSSFVLKTVRHCVYFGGDSGYYPGFAELGEAYGPFDLTMLEIGASDPLWPDIHMGPDGARRAYVDLNKSDVGGGALLPIHWGLFNLAFHAWYEPVERLLQLAPSSKIPLLLPPPGMPIEVADASLIPECWWLRFKS